MLGCVRATVNQNSDTNRAVPHVRYHHLKVQSRGSISHQDIFNPKNHNIFMINYEKRTLVFLMPNLERRTMVFLSQNLKDFLTVFCAKEEGLGS